MSNSRISCKEPGQSNNGTYFDELPLAGIPVPEPCTTPEMDLECIKNLPERTMQKLDTKELPTSIDILILKGLFSKQIAVEDRTEPIIVYNKLTGLKYAQDGRSNGYKAIHVIVGNKNFLLPVHRIAYYASLTKKEEFDVLGSKYDIHHIDGNKHNNHVSNIMPVLKSLHTTKGAYASTYEGARLEAQFLAVRRNVSNEFAASIVKSVRVIESYFARGSSKKCPVSNYFAKVLGTNKDYIIRICTYRRCKKIPDASPVQAEKIRAHYDWIFQQLEANGYKSDYELIEPEGFEHLLVLDGDEVIEQERQRTDSEIPSKEEGKRVQQSA